MDANCGCPTQKWGIGAQRPKTLARSFSRLHTAIMRRDILDDVSLSVSRCVGDRLVVVTTDRLRQPLLFCAVQKTEGRNVVAGLPPPPFRVFWRGLGLLNSGRL